MRSARRPPRNPRAQERRYRVKSGGNTHRSQPTIRNCAINYLETLAVGQMAVHVFRADERLFELSTITVGPMAWFKAVEVAACLGYVSPIKAVRVHVETEDRKTYGELTQGSDERSRCCKPQLHTTYINEPGLYSLALRSKMPQAKAFKRWVTHDVLPSLRRFGTYSTTKVHQACNALLTHDPATEPEEEARHLYIMKYGFDDTVVKIGRTRDVEKRRQQLQGCHNFVMEVVAIFPDAGHLESVAHTALAPRRSCQGSGREWFAVDAQTAIAVVNGILAASTSARSETAMQLD